MTIQNHPNSRFEVFLVAFSLLFIEALYFKTILFLHDYLNALFIISYALTGLAIGAAISHCCRHISPNAVVTLKLVMIFSILLSFINLIYFNELLFLSPALILPFAAGNVLISHYLKQNNAYKVYFIDLFGATTGVLSTVFLLPLIREENCFILIISILLLSLIFNRPVKSEGFITALISAVIVLGLLGYNLKYDPINLVKIARPPSVDHRDKVYARYHEFNLLYSKGSNIQRIDVLTPSYYGFSESEWPPMIYVAFNGLVNDVVRAEPYSRFTYRYDPRVIYGLVEKPDFLVIGTSAEGVVKTGAAHGGKVAGLEINPQIIDLMQGPLYSYSKEAYGLLDNLYDMDARTYFLQNNTKFDIITLMNSHMGRHSGLIGTPEFLHTREAIDTYMDHLTDRGFVVFEEKYYGDHGRLSSIKIIHTILDTLRLQGIEHPRNHLYVYHWILNGLSILGDPEEPLVSHVMIVVKKQPFTRKDRSAINYWARQVDRYYGPTHEIIEIYPENEIPGIFTSQVNKFINNYPDIKKTENNKNNSTNDFSVVTDDKPFPWSVDIRHRHIKTFLYKIAGLALVIVLGILIYWQVREKTLLRLSFFSDGLYFGLIGLGYFIIEIGLMNFYQIFMGSPTYAFIFILGALLLSSGLGSYFADRMRIHKAGWVFGGIILLCAYHLFLGHHIMMFSAAEPLYNSIIIALSVFPLGFLMGIPFPFGLETAKGRYNQQHANVFFAVNCLFSSFAVILSFYLSVAHGFKITFGVGILLYVMAFLLQLLNDRFLAKPLNRF